MAALAPAGARTADLPPGGTFFDDDRDIHEPNIEAIAAAGITRGCHDEIALFCPDRPVTRGEMAAFLVRALGLVGDGEDRFVDDEESIFERDIDIVAANGVTLGCDPPTNERYCPDRAVRRGEMAAFLSRALDLAGQYPDPGTRFEDLDGVIFELDIRRLAASGITVGCNPPDNTQFCPYHVVTRAQMASFLARAIGLEPIPPPPRPAPERFVRFTTYHDCCEARVTNIHVMARAMDRAVVYPGQRFSINDYLGPRTRSKGYVPAPILLNGEGYCCDHPLNIGGGTSQFGTTFYNAVFRGGLDVVAHKPHSRYIARYPLGIEATLGYPSPDVVFVNDTEQPVTIRTSYTSTSITVALYGDTGGRRVSWDVDNLSGHRITYNNGGTVRIRRFITNPGTDTTTETWYWTYSD